MPATRTPIQIPINSMTMPKATAVSSRTRPTSVKLKSTTSTPKPKPTKPQPTPERLARTPEELALKIKSYHKDAERICLAEYANDTHDSDYYCPCLPNEFRTYNSYDFMKMFPHHKSISQSINQSISQSINHLFESGKSP